MQNSPFMSGCFDVNGGRESGDNGADNPVGSESCRDNGDRTFGGRFRLFFLLEFANSSLISRKQKTIESDERLYLQPLILYWKRY